MSSAASVPTVAPVTSSIGLLASLRRIGAVLVGKARQLAGAVRATGVQVAQYVGTKLAISPSAVLPLALVALVIVALVLARRA